MDKNEKVLLIGANINNDEDFFVPAEEFFAD